MIVKEIYFKPQNPNPLFDFMHYGMYESLNN